jgi:DNA sulfur modification protein DndD
LTLDKLVVENFGIYLNRHEISLTPPSKKKPIVLFGGMNGAGKTTLLDALQLGLHGKRARCSNRGTGSYDEFLRASVNRFADVSGGASVEVHFHHVNDGREQSYRVCRSWHANGNGMKETVDVFVDGTRDTAVSDAWAEYAEEFIPAKLSHLFFFDGEKIEALADLENASELLRSGIHSLLGLDIVDRLHADLDVVAGRKNKQLKVDDEIASAVEQARNEVAEIVSRRDELVQNLGANQAQLEQSGYRHQKLVERLQSEGGDLFKQKGVLEANKVRLEGEVEALDASLRDEAGGVAPLLLVRDLLEMMHEQTKRERVAESAHLLGGVLQGRDSMLLKGMREAGAKPALIKTISDLLDRDRRSRMVATKTPRYLGLSEEAQSLLRELSSSELPAFQLKAGHQVARRKELVEELAVIERKLSMVPEEDAIAPLENERRDLEERREILAREQARLQEERRLLENDISRKQSIFSRLFDKATRIELEQEDVARVQEHSRRAQNALTAFREKVVERHIEAIQDYVLESFRYLVRKKSLLSSIRIDSRTFVIELRAGDGELVKPDRLSAGERQLLAVSLLWGLAKASRRPLPAIIDTPLGRLDSSHRRHLVERYFPHASHQVLLLSTDEEIRGEYLDAIRPSVGHSYLLEFNEAERSSTVKTGYFEREGSDVS